MVAIENIGKLLEDAILINQSTKVDNNGKQKGSLYDNYYALFYLGDEPYVARIQVKNREAYGIENITYSAIAKNKKDEVQTSSKLNGLLPTTHPEISMRDFVEIVNETFPK